jgi:hypothetical protein
MDRWVAYVDVGGIWAWLALAAGAVGLLTVIFALGKPHKRPSAIFAIEMGLLAFALGGLGWFIHKGRTDEQLNRAADKLAAAPRVNDRARNTAQSEAAQDVIAQMALDAERVTMRPVRIAIVAGGAPLVLGGLLYLMGGSTPRRRLG